VARHNIFCDPWKHSGKSSNLKYPPAHHRRLNVNAELTWTETCFNFH